MTRSPRPTAIARRSRRPRVPRAPAGPVAGKSPNAFPGRVPRGRRPHLGSRSLGVPLTDPRRGGVRRLSLACVGRQSRFAGRPMRQQRGRIQSVASASAIKRSSSRDRIALKLANRTTTCFIPTGKTTYTATPPMLNIHVSIYIEIWVRCQHPTWRPFVLVMPDVRCGSRRGRVLRTRQLCPANIHVTNVRALER